MTREQIAAFVMRYLALIGHDAGEGKSLSYTDKDDISNYAMEAVAVCSELGLFQGDNNNCFLPKDNANRAEAAAICARLHQKLNGMDKPEEDSDAPAWTPVIPDHGEDDDTPGSTTTYHKVTFANPAAGEHAASELPDSSMVEENSLVYNLPLPERDNHVFCGWFYDENLTRLAATTDTVTADITLYPKMVERTGSEDDEWPVYSLNYVAALDVAPGFTVKVQAASEQQIRDNLTFAAYSESDGKIDFDIVSEGGGIYILKPKGGLVAGDTYQIIGNDRDIAPTINADGSLTEPDYVLFLYEGEVMPAEVQYFNITVADRPHDNMRLDNRIIFLPFDQVSGMDLESAMLYTMSEEGFEVNENGGTFVYEGNALSAGDIVAIYDGILDEETHEVDGDLAYVKISEIHGDIYSYVAPSLDEILFTPQALPIPRDDTTTDEVDGAIFNGDGTVTVYNEYLDFSAFAEYEQLSLDGKTTAEVGDYLVLYTGVPGELETAADHAYYKITGILDGGRSAVTTFTVVECDGFETLSVYETYTGDLGITDEATAELESEAEQQAIESGFAEETADYLTAVLLSGEEMQETFGEYSLKNVKIRSASRSGDRAWYDGGEWDPEIGEDQSLFIEAGAIEAGVGTLMVEVGKVDVHVVGTTDLKEITEMDEGLRLELGLTFSVQIGNYVVGTGWSDCINLQVSASFVQEVAFSPFAKITEVTDTFLGIPYIEEFRVKAGVDVGTYVGVGATFTVLSADDFDSTFPWVEAIRQLDPDYDPACPNIDSIAEQIRKMMGDETTFALGNGKESLISIYQDLLEKEIDYVEILDIRCPGCPIKIPLPYKIGQVKINIELVISAKMSVTVGLAMENLTVRRYEFNAWINIIKFKAGYNTNTMDLQTPYAEMNLYIMGNIGLRVGPRISVEISLLSVGNSKKMALATAGFSVYFGYTVDMYGIYFMHLRVEDGEVTDGSRCIGALDANHGIFLDLDYHLGVMLDLLAVDLHLLDITWNILDKKGEPRVFEATKRTHEAQLWNTETSYQINSDLLRLNTLIVKTGELGQKTTLSHKDFNVELSNPNFTYNKDDGSITVTAPEGSVLEECEIRLTYTGSDTLFSSTPITVTINLKWEKTWPSYYVRVYGKTFSRGDGTYGVLDWPILEYKFVQGDTITGIELPVREVAGYNFLGWYYINGSLEGVKNPTLLSDLNNLEGYIMPAGDINIAPLYEARTDTPYTLNYYVETTDGTGAYELVKSVIHTGRTDSYLNLYGVNLRIGEDLGDTDGLEYSYGRLPTNAIGTVLGYVPIRGDGSGSGDIYLDRNRYAVYYHTNNNDYVGATTIQTYGVYGAELKSPPDLANANVPGWSFVGWTDVYGNPVDIPDTIPTDTGKSSITIDGTYYAGGTHYFAQWEPSFNYYTVNHYLKMPNGEYELVESQVGSDSNPACGGYTGEYIPVSDFLKEIDGATLSHYYCATADGVETTRIAGVPGTGPDTRQHNGQVLDIYYDRQYYRVFWNTADGEILQYYYTGQTIVAPEGMKVEERVGYVIDGWKNTAGIAIGAQPTEFYREGSTLTMGEFYKNFEPNYVPAEGTKYTVIHKRPADGSYGTFSDETKWETEELYGTTDALVTAEVKTYPGYVSPEAKELYIKADGTATMTYEYVREDYTVTLDFAGGTEVNYARNYYYDMSFKLPKTVTREGYEFKGWLLTTEGCYADIDEYDGYVYGDCLTSMKDLSFTAQWEAKPIDYRVEHYLEQLDGGYKLQQTDRLTGTLDENVTAAEAQFTGFTYDEANAGNVTGGSVASDGSLVLKLYYTRNSYDAKWYDYDGTALLATTAFKYGETITAPEAAASRTGYTWDGWEIGTVTMGTNGASFNAKEHGTWSANTYEVVFDANGGEGSMDSQSMTYDKAADLMANSFVRAGYTFAGWSLTAEGEVRYADRAQVSNLTADANASVTLYVKWTAGEGTAYKVEYYLEDLAGDYDVQTETFTGLTGELVTVTAKAITGFSYDSGNAGNVLSGTIAGDGSLALKLYYTRNEYTLTLDFNGESMKQVVTDPDTYMMELAGFEIEDKTVTLKYGQSLDEALKGITVCVLVQKEGWTTDPETGENVYIDNDVYGDIAFETAFPGYTFKEWTDCPDTMPAEDLTLTAEWTPIKVTVTFYSGSNYDMWENASITKEFFYGDIVSFRDVFDESNPVFAHEGYFISGWNYGFAPSNGSTITGELVLIDGYHTSYTCPYSVTGGGQGEYLMNPGEVHVFAFWSYEADRSTITFNGNGAANVAEYTQDVDGSGNYFTALLKNAFVREGYRFTGWNTMANGSGSSYGDLDMSITEWKNETILYAQWEEITE